MEFSRINMQLKIFVGFLCELCVIKTAQDNHIYSTYPLSDFLSDGIAF